MFAANQGGTQVATASAAEAIDFDGTNDYLSRSSDLVGNADGKTFTFSCWVWGGDLGANNLPIYVGTDALGNTRNYIILGTDSFGLKINIRMVNSSFSNAMVATGTVSNYIPSGTWIHILISGDNSTNTLKCAIQDVVVTLTDDYSSTDDIKFTFQYHRIGIDASNKCKGRLSHIFLDYTYRDLSVEANRRLFITADRKPTPKATLAALNPILYMPMDDPTTAHINEGTGGNFNLTGTVARSGRGPNQGVVPYSDLNGSSQYLSRTSLTGVADGKQVTISCSFVADSITGNDYLINIGTSGADTFALRRASGLLQLLAFTTGQSSTVVSVDITSNLVIGRNYHIVVSFDAADTGKRHAYLNGQTPSDISWHAYNNSTIDLTQSAYRVGAFHSDTSSNWDGRLGNLYFNTTYIDLSIPANLAKFCTGTGIDCKPLPLGANGELPTGLSPLIYLPMYGNNAGKNYGTGGDFTVVSGPFVGARGPDEYWGNKADFDGSTGYLARTSALSGIADGKTFSCSFSFNSDSVAAGQVYLLNMGASADGRGFWVQRSGSVLRLFGYDSTGGQVLLCSFGTLSAATQYSVQACVDLADAGKRFVYLNGVSQSVTWSAYTNSNISYTTADRIRFGASIDTTPANYYDGKLSEFYFTTDYIDFSQEANRLKFRDCFGNPVELQSQIAAGTIPNPAVYLRFDPANQGKNYGTGGDFTKSGTITDGGNL